MTKSAPLLAESNCGWIVVSARHRYRARHVSTATDLGASRYLWLVDESLIDQKFMLVKLGSSNRYHIDSGSRSIDEGWRVIWHGKQAMNEDLTRRRAS